VFVLENPASIVARRKCTWPVREDREVGAGGVASRLVKEEEVAAAAVSERQQVDSRLSKTGLGRK
jgi:hypothetical protein